MFKTDRMFKTDVWMLKRPHTAARAISPAEPDTQRFRLGPCLAACGSQPLYACVLSSIFPQNADTVVSPQRVAAIVKCDNPVKSWHSAGHPVST